jgi:hypothetical protein
MSQLSSQVALLFVVTTGAGVVMSRLAVRANLLRLRAPRRCKACGRELRRDACPHCG